MRKLSQFEKDFCERIIFIHNKFQGRDCYFRNILDPMLGNNIIITIYRSIISTKIIFLFQNQPTEDEKENIPDRIRDISLKLLSAVNLIKLLEKENYIILYQQGTYNTTLDIHLGQGIVNLPFFVESIFPDPKVRELLLEFAGKDIAITEEFRAFCNRKFLTREERQYKVGNILTAIAVGIALITGLYSILKSDSLTTKALPKQIDSLISINKSIGDKLDKINYSIKSKAQYNDTVIRQKK